MSSKMFVLALLCSFAVYVQSSDNCQLYGGKCKSKCDEEHTIPKELGDFCENKYEVCCNEYPNAERCYSEGGQCITDCPENIISHGEFAKDCPKGTNCCIYMN